MDTPTVSIIMPVYNVEKYIEQSITAVLAQTYSNFELILVDDCSPDKSAEICADFAAKDSRIKLIRKSRNGGLSEARNTGLDNAVGSYVLFLDSDDWIENNLLETALSYAEGSEITVFGINRVFENKDGESVRTEKLTPCTAVLSPADAFIELTKKKLFNYAWNKLYKRDFLLSCNARFEKIRLIEDVMFNAYVFEYASSVSIAAAELYNYRRPSHETLANTYVPEFFDLAKRKYLAEKHLLEHFGAASEENLQVIYLSYIKHLFSVFIRNNSPKSKLTKKEQKALISAAVSDPVSESVVGCFEPDSAVFRLLRRLLKEKRVSVIYLLTKMFNILKNSPV